jgi:hypothetical protein
MLSVPVTQHVFSLSVGQSGMGGHALHATVPDLLAYDVGEQGSHIVFPALFANVPGAQEVHTDAESTELYFPASQSLHEAAEPPPLSGLYFPAAQAWHGLFHPTVGVKVPDVQPVHSVAPCVRP